MQEKSKSGSRSRILRRAPSRRLGEKTPARRSGMLTDTAYLKLREMIFSGRLHPNDRLVESDLAEQLNVSRTPVREALHKLISEGLVAEAPRKGYVVAEFSPEFIIDNYTVREVLEGLAARLAAQNASELEVMQLEVELDAIAEASRANDVATVADHNMNFQMLIAKASRNVVLGSVLATLQDRLRMLRGYNFHVKGRREEAIKEQRELLGAVRARDGERAEHLAKSHVRNARQVRLTALSRRPQ
ncbi:MAG TPA: GntR family transcriptional regulator [Hyphomicrobiaceae bacterium]|jgi:DNA-binding GntR family transcriptional regulator|nr:GntR family transcriptional regulator [Hyphomicrobiaceae bacterium]